MLRHLLLEELGRRVLDAGLPRPERLLRRVEGRLGHLAAGDLLGDVGRHPERGIEQHRPLDQVGPPRRDLGREASAEAVPDPDRRPVDGLEHVLDVLVDRPRLLPAGAAVAAEVERAHVEAVGQVLLGEPAEAHAVRAHAVQADDLWGLPGAPGVLVEPQLSFPSSASTSGGRVSRQSPTTPTSACLKIGARSFALRATITPARTDPTMCSKAPRTPTSTSSLGATARPVSPIWRFLGSQPASVTSRLPPTAAPSASGLSFDLLERLRASDAFAHADDRGCGVELVGGRPGVVLAGDKPCPRLGEVTRAALDDLRLRVVARLDRGEHAGADGRELRCGRAHDHGDDVAAVGRLVLDQASRPVDAEVDAVARHPELELAGDARAVVPPLGGRGDQERMRLFVLDDPPERRGERLRVILGQALVVHDDDPLGAVAGRVARCFAQAAAEKQRDVRAAQLPRQLAALSEKLERDPPRRILHQLDDRPAVVVVTGLLAEPLGLVPGGGRRPLEVGEELEDAPGGRLRAWRRPRRGARASRP